MKAIIVYHSITGNTKKIAEAIQSGITRTGNTCDISPLKDIKLPDLMSYDLIGLGSFVIWLREMRNVTDFIRSLKGLDGKHAFVFCTHGALPAFFLSRVVPAIQERGLLVVGWHDWFSSVYYPCVPKPYFTDGHPDMIDLAEAQMFGQETIQRSARIYAGETQLIPTFPSGEEYDKIYNPLMMNRKHDAKRPDNRQGIEFMQNKDFRINTQKCKYPQCTFCQDNCPMRAIDLSATQPFDQKKCDLCWQCEMACPQGAIEYDFEPLQKRENIDDLRMSLELFESQGRFRRLIPLDKVGWNTPFWTYKKPRYKISK